MVSMNRLTNERRAQVLRCLVEGNSIRATVRMTGVAKNTISKLLLDVGEACAKHHAALPAGPLVYNRTVRNLRW